MSVAKSSTEERDSLRAEAKNGLKPRDLIAQIFFLFCVKIDFLNGIRHRVQFSLQQQYSFSCDKNIVQPLVCLWRCVYYPGDDTIFTNIAAPKGETPVITTSSNSPNLSTELTPLWFDDAYWRPGEIPWDILGIWLGNFKDCCHNRLVIFAWPIACTPTMDDSLPRLWSASIHSQFLTLHFLPRDAFLLCKSKAKRHWAGQSEASAPKSTYGNLSLSSLVFFY